MVLVSIHSYDIWLPSRARIECSSCACARSPPEGERALARGVIPFAQRDRALHVRDHALPTRHRSLLPVDNPLAPNVLSPAVLVCLPPAGDRTLARHVLPLASLDCALDARDYPLPQHDRSHRAGEIPLAQGELPLTQRERALHARDHPLLPLDGSPCAGEITLGASVLSLVPLCRSPLAGADPLAQRELPRSLHAGRHPHP